MTFAMDASFAVPQQDYQMINWPNWWDPDPDPDPDTQPDLLIHLSDEVIIGQANRNNSMKTWGRVNIQ